MPLYYLLYFWLIFSAKVPVTKIARANQLIVDAEESYKNGHYVLALVKYRYLTNSLKFKDSHLLLNLAHCYFLNNDKDQAEKYYKGFANSSNITIRSIAFQQLGIIAFEKKQYKKALDYFRSSLAADPSNEESRYNYELTAKKLPAVAEKEKVEKENKKKNPDQKESPPPEDEDIIRQSETKSNDGYEKKEVETEQQKEIHRKLKNINLSEEKANMILDAMKNSEIQYIQQTKKQAENPEEKNLPDW